jgi:hypothetical protein
MQYIVRYNTANHGPYFANRLPLLRQFCVTSLFSESQLAALQHMVSACKLHLCGELFDLNHQPITLASMGSIYLTRAQIYEKTYVT